METNVLDKAVALASEKLKVIEAPAKEKAEAEAKVAAEAKAQADAKTKKDEGIKLAEAEAQAKEDERILTVEDKDLSEPELKRKAVLQETKRKKDESPDEKIKRVQEASQKRIDEIKSELLQKEHKSNELIAKLQAELDSLKKAVQPKIEEDAKSKSKREESERIAKYVEEDKVKPREERREMSKDALEEWYLEDPVEATTWMQERTNRRVEERKAQELKAKEEETKGKAKTDANDFITKQRESRDKLFAKYPGVNPSPEKLASLKGKTDTEITAALSAESEEFRLCTEIVAEDPKKYLESVNGPELVMAEIEKRLKKPESKKVVTLTEEELEAKIQAEAERRARLDEGITSTKGKKMETNQNKSELRQRQEAIAKKAGIKIEDLDKTIERRRSIPGSGTFEDAKDG